MELVLNVVLALDDCLGGKQEQTFYVTLLDGDAFFFEILFYLW